MANSKSIMLSPAFYLVFLLALATCSCSSRHLNEQSPEAATTSPPPAFQSSDPASTPAVTDPSTDSPSSPVDPTDPSADSTSAPVTTDPSLDSPSAPLPPDAAAAGTPPPPPVPDTASDTAAPPAISPAASPPPPDVTAATGPDHPLTFFMHDIVGGSTPSTRIVTGVVASTAANTKLPFARPNKDIFPIQGALPLPDGVSNVIDANNIPYVAGLGGTSTTIVQNNPNAANGGSNNLPFVNAGNLPAGTTLQNLLFGTTTVIDDELTEGHEIGSTVIGRAQGFYVASSQDGTSQTLLLTAIFEGHVDTISFFGVHRTAMPECHIAIIGGTGKYENAKGFAAIQTLHPADQHTTDGVETLLQFSVHLS